MTTIVSYDYSDKTAVVAMDDGKANALSTSMLEELSAAIDRADADADALVLSGRAGRFCAGFDLKEMMQGPAAARKLIVFGGEVLLRLYELRLPVVIACTGHALAGGALLVATGDTRIGAAGDYKIGLNEVRNGMPVPILAHELARDRLLPSELFSAVVQAKIYDPTSAKLAGWLDSVCDPAEVVDTALRAAAELRELPKAAYGASKRSLRRATIDYIRATLADNI